MVAQMSAYEASTLMVNLQKGSIVKLLLKGKIFKDHTEMAGIDYWQLDFIAKQAVMQGKITREMIREVRKEQNT